MYNEREMMASFSQVISKALLFFLTFISFYLVDVYIMFYL